MIVFTIFTSLMLCTVLLNAQTTTVCGNIKVIDSCSGTNGTYTAHFYVYYSTNNTNYCLYNKTINKSNDWESFSWNCSLVVDNSTPSYYIKVHVVSDYNSSCNANGVIGPLYCSDLSSCSNNNIVVLLK